jgi:N-acetyl-gamma-glutamyl-phosphate reductase
MSIRVAIVGPTGYTALWLIKLLLRHPSAKISYLASHREELPSIAEEFPELLGRCDLICKPIDPEAIAKAADVAFCCLPHVSAMQYVPHLIEAGLRVVDLSADYRLADAGLYERVYQHAHQDPEHLGEAVYGLPELYRDEIKDARLIANPGCYPTTAALSIAPLLDRDLVKADGIVINAASGTSGAGRSPKPNLHFPEMNEAFYPYGHGNHRHQPEIEQTLSDVAEQRASVLFVPHLLPIDRGILETIYLEPARDDLSEDALCDAFEDAYADEPFVRVRMEYPNVKHVRDTNYCDIHVRLSKGKVIVFSAIDNMIKGASGQAVQNMNLQFGEEETAGLL